jgi:hypothetical protein
MVPWWVCIHELAATILPHVEYERAAMSTPMPIFPSLIGDRLVERQIVSQEIKKRGCTHVWPYCSSAGWESICGDST